jgi:hypothetical protein
MVAVVIVGGCGVCSGSGITAVVGISGGGSSSRWQG